jgi:diguanylate cyclase (GGDEF)-like protein/PAS domain S-box-containing protein
MDLFELASQGENDGLWDWDLTSNRIHFSSRWNSILGSEESILGNSPEEWFRRVHPEDLEQVKREIKSHIQNGSPKFEIQHRMLHSDNSYRWMSCHGVITRNKDGKAIRIAGTHSDITGEKVVDDLTGLPNKILLLDRLTRCIKIADDRSSNLFAILLLDLDLPEYMDSCLEPNDRDLVLTAAARRMETCLRVVDTASSPGREHVVARSDGNEFIILIDGLNGVSESKIIAGQLLKEMSAPFEVNGCDVFLSASIGIALSATGYRSAKEVLRDADIALYRAKSLGKGRCEVYDTAIFKSLKAKMALENDLRQALEQQELSVFYQPILSLSSYQVAGFEALVRWKHPIRGTISPVEFIPVAEKTGLMIPLGQWIIKEVCQQLKAWGENPEVGDNLWVSVNLSSTQFKSPLLVKDICKILLEVGHDANSLILELTEGEVMDNPEAANRILMQLRVIGARIALDDFGTGYSSLAHLCRFPLDYLKIDQSFVKNIETSAEAQEIIRTIINLAHQLGLSVITEGIENPAQLDLISSLGCEYGQGFLFSKAISKYDIIPFLKKDFTWVTSDIKPSTISCSDNVKHDTAITETSSLTAVNSGLERQTILQKQAKLWISKVPIITVSSVVILLFTVGLLGSYMTSVFNSPPDEIKIPSPEGYASKPLLNTPKIIERKERAHEYKYEVIHDHFLGSCKGTLKVTKDNLSYIAENGKCSFDVVYPVIRYSLDKDQLEIKTESKAYHFKLIKFSSREENQSKLQEIMKRISNFSQQSVSKK